MHCFFPQPKRTPARQQDGLLFKVSRRESWAIVPLLLTITLLVALYPLLPTLSATLLPNLVLSASPTPSPTLSQHTQTTPTREAVQIRWFMRWDAARIRDIAIPILTQFRATQSGIAVALENVNSSSDYYRRLQLQLEEGQPPDVLYLATHAAYELYTQGALLSLNELIRQDGLDLQGFDPALLDLYRNDLGQIYCLPVDMATMAVLYNRALFEKAAVAAPQGPWTWDEFLSVASALTHDQDNDGVPEQFGVDQFYSYWPLLIWSWTGHNVFDNPRFPTAFLLEEEQSVDALQWLADLALQHGVMPPVNFSEQPNDLFRAGSAAMQVTGYWQLPTYLAAGIDVGVAPLPTGEHLVNRNDGSCLAIAQATRLHQEAWNFLKFLLGPQGIGAHMVQSQGTDRPAIATLYHRSFVIDPFHLATATENLQEGTDQLDVAWPAPGTVKTFPLYDPLHTMYREWQPIVDSELTSLWRGQRDADEVVGRMANAAEDILEDLPTVAATAAPAPIVERRAAGEKSSVPAATTRQATPPLTTTLVMTDFLATDLFAAGLLTATTSPTTPIASPVTLDPAAEGADEMPAPALSQRLPRHYFVDPTGDNDNSGLLASVPLATIQHALELVEPGDTIHLAAGDYYENLTSVTAGRAGAPITIMGPSDAIIRGTGEASAAFYLTHDYYTFTGFTFDGLYGDPTDKDGYTQKLLYVQGMGGKKGVTGLRVLHMTFRNAGGECLRLRYFAHNNEIAYSTFQVCGLLDFVFNEGGKNGEAIYVGTASDQWSDGKNPTADPDASTNNWIHHNIMDTQGNECVEVKEGGYANLIEYNLCTGQLDPDSAGIGARGSRNVIRYNTIYSNVGAGIRLGGHEVDGVQYGVNNLVYGNNLLSNIAGGVKIIIDPQKRICGNYLTRNLGKQAFGEGSEGYEPAAPC